MVAKVVINTQFGWPALAVPDLQVIFHAKLCPNLFSWAQLKWNAPPDNENGLRG